MSGVCSSDLVAAFELTRQGDHRTPGLDEPPARLDGHEDVQTASAGGLGVNDETQFVEQWPQHINGDTARVGEVRARVRTEVAPELVGLGKGKASGREQGGRRG